VDAYQHYSSVGGTSSHDPTMHSFAPVSSVLDLRNPSTGQNQPFTASAVGLGLMNVRSSSSGLVQEQFKRFGFPHLAYPSNHYQVTPYDGVYAVGTNNVDFNSNPKPDNQCHVEDVQAPVADYLSQTEVAPIKLYLSNQTVGASAYNFSGYTGGYKAEFEAREKIITGNSYNGSNTIYDLESTQPFLTPQGDFKVAVAVSASLHAGVSIELYSGTEFPQGSEVAVYIQAYPSTSGCNNVLGRQAMTHNNQTVPVISDGIKNQNDVSIPIVAENVQIYPNPANARVVIKNYSANEFSQATIYDIGGKVVHKAELINGQENAVDLKSLENGIYILRIESKSFKLIIDK